MRTSLTFSFNARDLALTTSLALGSGTIGCGDDGSSTGEESSIGTTEASGTTEDATSSDTGSETTHDTTVGTTDPSGSTSSGSSTSEPETSSDSTGGDSLEIIGEWIEAYPGGMTTHTITSDAWTQASDFGTFTYTLDVFDNAARWVIGIDEGDGSYSRFDWTWDTDDELHYCTAAFGLDTLREAMDAPTTDETDLDAGCGGFGWSHLAPG